SQLRLPAGAMIAWKSTNTAQMDDNLTAVKNKDVERSAWGSHIFVSVVAAVPIAGLVAIAAVLIVYTMRVLAVSMHRTREFIFMAAYAAVYFPTGLFDL